MRDRYHPAMVYAGDDVTDEDAFAALGPGDVAVKVGAGPTSATHRLRDTSAAGAWPRATVDALEPT